jgi:protein TonB
MTRFRHGSSFLISSSIYSLLILLYVSFLNIPKPIDKKEHIVKITVITPPPPPKVEPKPLISPPKPIVVPPKPKPKPKPKKKKKIIKKPKPKPKPKKKKKIVKKPKPKPKVKKRIKPKPKPVVEEIYNEPIIEEIYPEPIKKANPTPVVKTAPSPTPKVDLSAHKQRFKDRVRANIIANKKYPRMAKRRRIQGTVHVVFDINRDGTVTNIRTSGASMLLQKATKRSIKKSFPVDIPDIIIGEFPMRNVSINIDFILE